MIIKNNLLSFELETADYIDYYTFEKVPKLGVETGIYNGTYYNEESNETIIVENNKITFNNCLEINYLIGNTVIVWAEDNNSVLLETIEFTEKGFNLTGVLYSREQDYFFSLNKTTYVKIN